MRKYPKQYAFNNIKINQLLPNDLSSEILVTHKSNLVNDKIFFDPFSYRDHVTFRKYSFSKLKQNCKAHQKSDKMQQKQLQEEEQMIDLIQQLKLWKQIKSKRNQILVQNTKGHGNDTNNSNDHSQKGLQESNAQLKHKKLKYLKKIVNKQIYQMNKSYLREYLVNNKKFIQQYSQLNARSSVRTQLDNIRKIIQSSEGEAKIKVKTEEDQQNIYDIKDIKSITKKDKSLIIKNSDKAQKLTKRVKTQVINSNSDMKGYVITKQTQKELDFSYSKKTMPIPVYNNKYNKLKTQVNQKKQNKKLKVNRYKSQVKIQKIKQNKIQKQKDTIGKPISLLKFKEKQVDLKNVDQFFERQSDKIQSQIFHRYRREVNYKFSNSNCEKKNQNQNQNLNSYSNSNQNFNFNNLNNTTPKLFQILSQSVNIRKKLF